MMNFRQDFPLISVIIPTYNYGHFINEAIASVLTQSYRNTEIIVIDDGSTDNTKDILSSNHNVRYCYQQNKGLSAARNAGIAHARGDYFVFLDADDWLENGALEQNYNLLKRNPGAAFVSGNYYLLRRETNKCEAISVSVTHHHYQRLLQSNYIGMHAAVMFHRWAFNHIQYDETLRACEDYDLYLRMARRYPVLHHQAFIATYNFHSKGLSHNYQAMIDSIQKVMQKQVPFVRNFEEEQALQKGMQQWKDYKTLSLATL